MKSTQKCYRKYFTVIPHYTILRTVLQNLILPWKRWKIDARRNQRRNTWSSLAGRWGGVGHRWKHEGGKGGGECAPHRKQEAGKGITGWSENADEEDGRLGVHGRCDTSKWRQGPERGLPLSVIWRRWDFILQTSGIFKELKPGRALTGLLYSKVGTTLPILDATWEPVLLPLPLRRTSVKAVSGQFPTCPQARATCRVDAQKMWAGWLREAGVIRKGSK